MRITLLLFFCFFSISSFAIHGKGGVLTYEYLGPGSTANTSKYRVTSKEYFDCHGSQFILTPIYIGIYDAGTKLLLRTETVDRTSQITIEKISFGCINPAPEVCYVVSEFTKEIELPDNTAGYILVEQECCRVSNLVNIQSSSGYGMSSYNIIPGVINNVVYRNNSSPVFAQKDTAVICYNSSFTLDMSATDKDGDSLAYAFCAAKASNGTARQPNPPSPPPYNDLPYRNGFTSGQPLGSTVSIDPKTGIISGVAPGITGPYIISVCVYEYRNGVLIGETKKEVQVEVAQCSSSVASLKPSYINCDDFDFTFKTESVSTNVSKYFWDFGVPGISTDTSSLATPTYLYADTGKYTIKLKVTSDSGCEDSTTSELSVYPGFEPGFQLLDSCLREPFRIKDTTKATYGAVTSWTWNFGDNSTSTIQNPTHQYFIPGNYRIGLLTTSSKGCIDSTFKNVTVYEPPSLTLAFKDTLICSIDTLMLKATGLGNFTWSPAYNILTTTSQSPLVFPKDTTIYTATVNYHGCIIKDSTKINVLDFITVDLLGDTTICKTDSIQLKPVSDALQYTWVPSTGLSNAFAKSPMASPANDIIYQVIANLGKCQDDAFVNIKVVPYPTVNAGLDTTICHGTSAQLNAVMQASIFTWSPTRSLINANTLNPIASPLQKTSYIITVSDILGCPKEVSDTVVVTVLPKIFAFAGNDTTVVIGQPLQLNGSGGDLYSWAPSIGLNNTIIANPVGVYDGTVESVEYILRVERTDGCFAYDTMIVKIFKTGADIFVPSGFTPNNDGKNDILKPTLVGMQNLESFKVFNRWGQLVFSTNVSGRGWDGKINGVQQTTNAFVYVAIGTTYLGQRIIKKGTVMLIL